MSNFAGPITITFRGFYVAPLPDLGTASLAELQEAEWSGREPCKATDGAWHVCQCCGNAKIDGKGHKPGCAMAAALAARAE
jgi:hypothetical protein